MTPPRLVVLWSLVGAATLGLLASFAGMTAGVLRNRLLHDELRLLAVTLEAEIDPCTQARWQCDESGRPKGAPAVQLGPLGGWWSGPWWWPGPAAVAPLEGESPRRIDVPALAESATQIRDVVLLHTALVAVLTGAVAWAWGPLRTRRRVRRLERALADLAAGRSTRPADREALGAALADTVQALEATRETLVRTERVAALGWFAGGLAHQFGNPLAAARQYLAVLDRRIAAGDPARPPLLRLGEQLERLHRAVEGMLRLARPERIERRPVEVAALVRGILAELAAGLDRPLEAKLEITDDLRLVTDAAALEQILVNLLRNAAEAQPEAVRLEISAALTAGQCRIVIRDHGPGLPAGGPPQLESTKPHGTGLGLPLAQRLAELLGGRLTLGPAIGGRGAEAVLSLPREPAAADAGPKVS